MFRVASCSAGFVSTTWHDLPCAAEAFALSGPEQRPIPSSALLVAKGARGYANASGERPREVGGIIESGLRGDNVDVEFRFREQAPGSGYTQLDQVVLGGEAGRGADRLAKRSSGHSQALCAFGHRERQLGCAAEL